MKIVGNSDYTDQNFRALSQNLAFLGWTSCKFVGLHIVFIQEKGQKEQKRFRHASKFAAVKENSLDSYAK